MTSWLPMLIMILAIVILGEMKKVFLKWKATLRKSSTWNEQCLLRNKGKAPLSPSAAESSQTGNSAMPLFAFLSSPEDAADNFKGLLQLLDNVDYKELVLSYLHSLETKNLVALRSNKDDEELLDVIENVPGVFAQFAHRWGPAQACTFQLMQSKERKAGNNKQKVCDSNPVNAASVMDGPQQLSGRKIGEYEEILSGPTPERESPETKPRDEIKDKDPCPSTSEAKPLAKREGSNQREHESFIGHQKVTPGYRAYQKLMDQIHDLPDDGTRKSGVAESPTSVKKTKEQGNRSAQEPGVRPLQENRMSKAGKTKER